MINSTSGGAVAARRRHDRGAKSRRKSILQRGEPAAKFGDRFACMIKTLDRADEAWENEMAKKKLKRSKKLEANKPLTVDVRLWK